MKRKKKTEEECFKRIMQEINIIYVYKIRLTIVTNFHWKLIWNLIFQLTQIELNLINMLYTGKF